MRRSRPFETIRVSADREGAAPSRYLLAVAFLAATITLVAPTVADAAPRDRDRDGVTVMSVGHPHHGHRQTRFYRSYDGHNYGHNYRHSNGHGSRHHDHRGRSHPRVERARRYASQATAQASTAWRMGCARSGPRWSTDWNDHYYWALDTRPRHLRRELDRREQHLRECRVWNRNSHRHYRQNRHYRPH